MIIGLRLLCAAALSLSMIVGMTAVAFALSWEAAQPQHPLYRDRKAIFVVSRYGRDPAEIQAGSEAAKALGDRLRLFGFDVAWAASGSRPELNADLWQAARGSPIGAEIALFVFGPTLADTSDVFVVPGDTGADLRAGSGSISTDAIQLTSIIRRFAARNPRELVVVLSDCRETEGVCPVSTASDAGAASVVAVRSRAIAPGPLARLSAARQVFVDLASIPRANFEDFYRSLSSPTQSLGTVARSDRLSQTFRFLPEGYFETLPNDCLQIDPQADDLVALGPSVRAGLKSCEAAISAAPFVSIYRSRLAAAREQAAFQDAVADCRNPGQAEGYARTYPDGRYTSAIARHKARCQPEAPQLQPKAQPQPKPVEQSSSFASVVGVRRDDPEGLNMRSGPASTYGRVGRIPYNGRNVAVHRCQKSPIESGRWCLVTFGGGSGWVAARFLAR